MKTTLTWLVWASFYALGFSQTNTPKILFVIVDGIPADVIEKVPTPNLDAISAEGGYTRAYMGGEKGGYSETPTISAVGYNSLLTGTWAHKHNVWGNDIKEPNYRYWTLFRFAKEYRPELKTAIFSTWEDNRTKLVGEGLPETAKIKLDYHFDGFEHDTITFPHGNDRLFIHKIDEHVTNEAARYIKKESPDLSWVYLEYTDDMGHQYGDSDPFYNAVKTMDGQIGRLWQAMHYRKKHHNEDWQVYITTDHGRNSETGKGHGGQSDRERLTWISTNAKNLNPYFKGQSPGIVDIAPTLLKALRIAPEKERMWEFDGVALTDSISVANAKAILDNDIIELTWDAFEEEGMLTIWIATTNVFAEGGTDEYTLVDHIPVKLNKTSIDVSTYPSNLYKIVLEGKHNAINTWALKK
ncbi:alkaline phosphatase family protein [Pareuzebyella sediminis]|uniref:alkaline phosphatase family protein n=1 Tax=Pareuzebyella sediminis TaxID=2607998 RepID=UPI0011EEC4FA|nr:alkaline phosphatase family protein [Pareuzebyella sediminis]